MRISLAAPLVATLLAAPAGGADCARTSVGLVALIDLAGTYQGAPGRLYPGGSNAPPAAHLGAGLEEAAQVVPRDASGAPAPGGKIGVVTIGMSNTRLESAAFLELAGVSPAVAPTVVLVNAAQGGQDAVTIDDPDAPYWTNVDRRVAEAGLTAAQVQACWLKEAIAEIDLAFPEDAELLRDSLRAIVRILRARFPNLRLAYLSSRIYAGYATTTLNPEPFAYQSGFAVRWLIEEQIGGSAALNFDPDLGPAVAPWLAWGPYLWANGLTPNREGLTWACSDLREDDGTHPSEAGSEKVGARLLDFFLGSPTTSPWFALPEPSQVLLLAAGATVLRLFRPAQRRSR